MKSNQSAKTRISLTADSTAKRLKLSAFLAASFAYVLLAALLNPSMAQEEGKVFELRTYTATPGNLDNLHARFRDHTTRIFHDTYFSQARNGGCRLLGAYRRRRC